MGHRMMLWQLICRPLGTRRCKKSQVSFFTGCRPCQLRSPQADMHQHSLPNSSSAELEYWRASLYVSRYSTGRCHRGQNLALCTLFAAQIWQRGSSSLSRRAFCRRSRKHTFGKRKHSIFYQSSSTIPLSSPQCSRGGSISRWVSPYLACNTWRQYPPHNTDSTDCPCQLRQLLRVVRLRLDWLPFSYLFISLGL
jgi:hypothetical protein